MRHTWSFPNADSLSLEQDINILYHLGIIPSLSFPYLFPFPSPPKKNTGLDEIYSKGLRSGRNCRWRSMVLGHEKKNNNIYCFMYEMDNFFEIPTPLGNWHGVGPRFCVKVRDAPWKWMVHLTHKRLMLGFLDILQNRWYSVVCNNKEFSPKN